MSLSRKLYFWINTTYPVILNDNWIYSIQLYGINPVVYSIINWIYSTLTILPLVPNIYTGVHTICTFPFPGYLLLNKRAASRTFFCFLFPFPLLLFMKWVQFVWRVVDNRALLCSSAFERYYIVRCLYKIQSAINIYIYKE